MTPPLLEWPPGLPLFDREVDETAFLLWTTHEPTTIGKRTRKPNTVRGLAARLQSAANRAKQGASFADLSPRTQMEYKVAMNAWARYQVAQFGWKPPEPTEEEKQESQLPADQFRAWLVRTKVVDGRADILVRATFGLTQDPAGPWGPRGRLEAALADLPKIARRSVSAGWRHLYEWCEETGRVQPHKITVIQDIDDGLTFTAIAWLHVRLSKAERPFIWRHKAWGEDKLAKVMDDTRLHASVKLILVWSLRYLIERAGESNWLIPVLPGGDVRALPEDHDFIHKQASNLFAEWRRRKNSKDMRNPADPRITRLLTDVLQPPPQEFEDEEEEDYPDDDLDDDLDDDA